MSTFEDIRSTLSEIAEHASRNIDTKADAEYEADAIEGWLDQLRREIADLEEDR